MHGTKESPIRIVVWPLKATDNGVWYWVEHDGVPLISRTKNPEHDACRALVAKGHTGRMETSNGTNTHTSLIFPDIEKAALVTISENASHGPKQVPFRLDHYHEDRQPASLNSNEGAC